MLTYYLARQGYFVAVPDLLYHGASKNSVKSGGKLNFNTIFTEMEQSMQRIQDVIDFLYEHYISQVNMEQLGIIGSSYGGYLALTAGYRFPQISYVASLCSSGTWKELIDKNSCEVFNIFSESRPVMRAELVNDFVKQYEPICHVNEYMDKKVILMNGGLDTTFTYELVKPFVEKMEQHYKEIECIDKFQWKKYRFAGHKVTYEMISDLLKWLDTI